MEKLKIFLLAFSLSEQNNMKITSQVIELRLDQTSIRVQRISLFTVMWSDPISHIRHATHKNAFFRIRGEIE